MNRYIFLFFLIFLISYTDPQQDKSTTANHAVLSLYEKGDSAYYDGEYEKSITVYQECLSELPTDDTLKIRSNLLNDIGLSYKKLGMFDSAIFYYLRAARINKNRNDSVLLSGRLRNIGNVYRSMGLFSSSLEYHQRALKLLGERYPKRKLSIQINLGNIYLDESLYSNALEIFLEALDGKSLSFDIQLAVLQNNIGFTYLKLYEFDSAYLYLTKALGLFKSYDFNQAHYTLDNLGLYFIETGQYDSASYYLQQSHDLAERINNSYAMVENELYHAKLALAQNQFQQANDYALSVLSYARKNENYKMKLGAYELLTDSYFRSGDLLRAYGFLKELSDLKENQFEVERNKLSEMRYQFDLEHEKESRLVAENKAQLAQLRATQSERGLYLMLAFLLFAVIAIVIFVKQRNSLKKQKNQIDTLNRQNFHFTKNSLLGIVALLNRQSRQIKDPKVKGFLVEEKLRMETVNVLYQQLFRSVTGDFVLLSEFLQMIVTNTIDTMLPEAVERTVLTLAPVSVTNEQALPIGLIVNEVCINACKYALHDQNQMEVTLEERPTSLILTLKDNGPGLPEDVEGEQNAGFGLSLISMMSEEINAELKVHSSEEGLVYVLIIPKKA